MGKIIGIDLGTTKSVVGAIKKQKPYIIPDKSGNLSIPSLILVTPDEEIFAGWDAKKHPKRYHGKNITISSIKRSIGKQGETGWGWWKTYPQEVSAFILAELKNQAEKYLGEEVEDAVVAIPSHFDESQRRATKEAAEIAGLKVKRLLNEATAAVLAYGFNKSDDRTVLVFDFGGGTLDVSIIETGEGVFEVLSTEGDSKLGGDDFDQIIVDYILDQIQQKFGQYVEINPMKKMMLKEVAESAKIDLSSKMSASIYIPGFLHIDKNRYNLDISIDRHTFEKLSKNLIDRAIAVAKKALESAQIRVYDNKQILIPCQLTDLLLLGGSGRIPHVKERIKKEFRIKPITGVDIETCVAQGAAIQAGILSGDTKKDMILMDTVPGSYGIGIKGEVFSKIIEKNTTVPTKHSETFTTSEDNQREISITIYQGESNLTSENVFLGTIELKDILPSPAGIPQIEVTFDVDVDMIIHVTAKDLGTGKEQKLQVKSPYGLNNTQIRLMKERCKSWFSQKQSSKLKHSAESLISSIENLLSKKTAALNWDKISNLKSSLKLLNRLVKEEKEYKELENALEKASSIYEVAEGKIVQYEAMEKQIEDFITRIERFISILRPIDEKEANRLHQGSNLLKDYLNRRLSINELQEILLPVKLGYEQAKAKLILKNFEELFLSDDFVNWSNNFETKMKKDMPKLREFEQVNFILSLLKSEDMECQKLILQRTLENITNDSISWAYFILIISTLVDYNILSKIDTFSNNDKINDILACTLFLGLNENNSFNQRKLSSQIIYEKLPDGKYIQTALENLGADNKDEVGINLIKYLQKQPTEDYQRYFSKAPQKIRNKISSHEPLLLKLLERNPDEKTCIFALEFLSKSPISDEILSHLHYFANNSNQNLQIKSLEMLINYKTTDKKTLKIFLNALQNFSPEIRLLALEFIKESKNTSLLSTVASIIKSERNEIVKEKAIKTLGSFKDVKVIFHLIEFIHDESPKINNLVLSCIEKNINLDNKDFRRFFDIIKQSVDKKYSLGIKDKIFLKKFSKNNPKMSEAVDNLRKVIEIKFTS